MNEWINYSFMKKGRKEQTPVQRHFQSHLRSTFCFTLLHLYSFPFAMQIPRFSPFPPQDCHCNHWNVYSSQFSLPELVLEPVVLPWLVQVLTSHKPLSPSQYLVVSTPLNPRALLACTTHVTVCNAMLCFCFTCIPSTHMCMWTVDLYVWN